MVGRLVRVMIVVLLIVFVGVKFLPLGIGEFQSKDTGKKFAVPNLAMSNGECCAYAATFKSVRSVWSLEQDVNKIIEDNYEEDVCANGERVYYDAKEDVTVRAYSVRLGFPFNEVIISYELGRKC